MQESFYALALHGKGMSAAMIGILIGIGWIVSSAGALFSAPATRWSKRGWCPW
jgi:hypothetical protein